MSAGLFIHSPDWGRDAKYFFLQMRRHGDKLFVCERLPRQQWCHAAPRRFLCSVASRRTFPAFPSIEMRLIGNHFEQQMRAKHVFVVTWILPQKHWSTSSFYYFQTQLPSKLWGIGSSSVSEVNQDTLTLTPSSVVEFVGWILMLLAASSQTVPYWMAASVFRSVSDPTVCPLLAVESLIKSQNPSGSIGPT